MIEEKLKILKENNIIDEQTHELVLKAGQFLIDKEIIQDIKEADVFLTHLAMAFSREEEINEVEPVIKEQLTTHPKHNEANNIWNDLEQALEINLPVNETDYMHMHLLTLIE